MDQKTEKDEKQILSLEELNKRMAGFSRDYFLVDIHRDKESYFAHYSEILSNLTPENFGSFSGIIMNHIMDGELDKAQEMLDSIPDEGYYPLLKMGLILVYPKVTYKQFIDIIEYLKKINFPMPNVILSASRPSILNGFNDFSRIGPFLKKNKELFI